MKWKVAELNVAEEMETESVELVEEAQVAEPVVRLPVAVEGGEGKAKRRRVGSLKGEEEEVREVGSWSPR